MQVLRKPNSAWPTFTMVIMLTALMTVRWTRGNGELHNDYNLNADKKAVLPQGNRAMLQVFFSVEVRQQHSLQV